MKYGAGHYVGKYLKKNGIALLFELIIVVLVSLICTIVIEASPVWFPSMLGVMAYLLAEVRFMMAYVARNVRQDREAEATVEEPGEPYDNGDTEGDVSGVKIVNVPAEPEKTTDDPVAAVFAESPSYREETPAEEPEYEDFEEVEEPFADDAESGNEPPKEDRDVEDLLQLLREEEDAPASSAQDEEERAIEDIFGGTTYENH